MECGHGLYALPSATVGIGNPKMRPLPVDHLPVMRGKGPPLPALPDALAGWRSHSGKTGRSAAVAPRAALRWLVEAGGVEPPSEKARTEETTCVSGSLFLAAASEPARIAAT